LTISSRTNNTCDSTAGDLIAYMDDETAAQTHVCYDGFTFYVVNPSPLVSGLSGVPAVTQFTALPGGTWDTMQDPRWVGLSLDDFVISSWEGYKKNGMKNGYSPMKNESDTAVLFSGDGVQTPGFASLWLCDLVSYTMTDCGYSAAV
jgi:hypothetical protein